MLTVVVGKEPNEKRFLVHEGFICARSEFFRRAINGPWVERDERLIKLLEDDPEIFATYINLVYTNNIATGPVERPMDVTRISAEHAFLAKLYVLSEKLCDSVAKNTVISAFFAVGLEQTSAGDTYSPGRDSIKLIYAGTPRGSRHAVCWQICGLALAWKINTSRFPKMNCARTSGLTLPWRYEKTDFQT